MTKYNDYISNDKAVDVLLDTPGAKAEHERLGPRYEIINRIVAARIAKEWTQADLARALGRHKQSITRLESGTQDPRLSTLVAVCQALNLPLADVFRGVDATGKAS
jgi:DNA-binding XRE family transcriptional regulator